MTAEDACAELWGLLCPDAGPTDYTALVDKAKRMMDQRDQVTDLLRSSSENLFHAGNRIMDLAAENDKLKQELEKS